MVSDEIVQLAALQEDWKTKLITSDKGAPLGILANAITAFRLAPEWRGVLAFNEFHFRTEAIAPPPWHVGNNAWIVRAWEDTDDIRAADWLQHHGIRVNADTAAKAVEAVSGDMSFHPVRDYLAGLQWDCSARAESFAVHYLGAEDSEYSRAVSSRFLIGAVARIMRPGAKVDHLPILEGEQGTFKSTALRTLGGEWFSDEIADIGSKDASLQTRGAWIIEIAELDSMSRAEISKVKAFLSRNVDRFRPPYGRRVIESPRQCVFAGSTNTELYLKDETGGRRFWPIRCGAIDLDSLSRDRDQLWAEAKVLYEAGEPWWLDRKTLIDAATVEQDARFDHDPWTEIVLDHLKARKETSTTEILRDAIGITTDRLNKRDQMRVGGILRKNGWKKYQRRGESGKPEYRYEKTSAVAP